MRRGELNRQNNQLSNVQSDSNKMREHESASVRQRERLPGPCRKFTDEGRPGSRSLLSELRREKAKRKRVKKDSENKFPRNRDAYRYKDLNKKIN